MSAAAGKPAPGEPPRRTEQKKMSSPRSFGLLFALVFALVGVWPWIHGSPPRLWSLVIAAAFLAVALAQPSVLAPLNRLWHGCGLLLGRIMTPVIMTILFVIAVIPTGLALRAMGRDPLRLKRDPQAESYWIKRETPPRPMRDQF